jgi:hypothetical protein
VVAALIEIIAKHEERDELQVYRDLTVADRDVIRVRAPDADDDGSVRIDAGVEIVSHARDLLLSAACSAYDPRPSYRAGGIKEAVEYMSRVRLGQTEQGSFVVALLAPVPPDLVAAQPSLWPQLDDEPFDRLVTRRLVNGLSAARSAAEESVRGGGQAAFDEAVGHGVSANLCEALSSLIDRGEGLDVSVTWAKTRPTPEPRRRIVYSRADGEVLREAARIFRSREPRSDERLEGFVIDLHRPPQQEVGTVTLRAPLDRQWVSIRVQLPGDQYGRVVTAHAEKKPISLTGDLRRVGHRWQLFNPRELAVIEPEADNG